MVKSVNPQVDLEPGDLARHIKAEFARKGMSRHETVSISGLWLRNIGGKAEVLVEVKTPKRGRVWYLVLQESLDSQFSHIAEVGGILDSPEDPITKR